MALPSSGQISLNDIATEFGGSAPHALSEYYGDGNAPASGEIQIAADFYGTSAGPTYMLNATMTCGSRNLKAGLDQDGYTSGTSDTNSGSSSIGSMTAVNFSNGQTTLRALYCQDNASNSGLQSNDEIRLYLQHNYTGWSQLYLKNLSTNTQHTLARTSGSQQAVQRSSSSFMWTWDLGSMTAVHAFQPNDSITVQIT
tara:strand:+ start:197 stop:790 length:594 start_codon:yes stop_codon:yes gene_type:complete